MRANNYEGGHFILPADLAEFRSSIDRWQDEGFEAGREGDKESADMHTQDVTDLERILGLVTAGNYEAAREATYDLDTLVRDQIPTTLYEKLMPE